MNQHKIVLVIVVLLFLVCSIPMINQEMTDRELLNKKYRPIYQDNSQCLNYLKDIAGLPVWRLSLILAVIVVVLYNLILFYVPQHKDFGTYVAHALILLLVVFASVYKFLNFFTWHYVCDDGCLDLHDS